MIDKKHKMILCENSIFIGQTLAITKKLYDELNNDDLQLLLLCFVPSMRPQ